VTLVSNMRGLLPSSTMFRSNSYPIISTSSRDSPIEASWAGLSITGIVNSDLDHISSYYTLYKVRLRFLLFGLSILVYILVEPTTLLDISRSEIRDSVEMEGGGEDGGELGGEEGGDDNDE
jgi:hypothetical protein